MTKADRLIETEGKIIRYNAVFDKAEPYIINYWKALKKIWEGKINGNNFRNDDYEIFKEYGLVEWRPNWGTSNGYVWNYDLMQLNKLIYRGRV